MGQGGVGMRMGTHEEVIEVRGARSRVLRAGSGEPLLYLHSILGEIRSLPFFDVLSRDFDVCAPAHPGFAGSEGLERIDTVHDLVFHYADVLDELGFEKPNIVGLCLGGWLAAELAVHYADRVGKLVLIDAMGLNIPGDFIPDIFAANPAETRSLLFKNPQSEVANGFLSDAPSAEMLDSMLTARQAAARIAWNPYLHDPRLQERLYRVKASSLILWGEDDRLLPVEHGRMYEKNISDARLAIVKECGHLPPLEKPLDAARQVLDFLRP
jgi:pimeloyl-ACP methyl ester carboxylesterase